MVLSGSKSSRRPVKDRYVNHDEEEIQFQKLSRSAFTACYLRLSFKRLVEDTCYWQAQRMVGRVLLSRSLGT